MVPDFLGLLLRVEDVSLETEELLGTSFKTRRGFKGIRKDEKKENPYLFLTSVEQSLPKSHVWKSKLSTGFFLLSDVFVPSEAKIRALSKTAPQ